MENKKFDQDPRNVTILKIVMSMCSNKDCRSKNVTIRKVGELKIYCCNRCGISSTTFIDA